MHISWLPLVMMMQLAALRTLSFSLKRTFRSPMTRLLSSPKHIGSAGSIQWPVERVRSEFIDYFAQRAHSHIPSSPCVPLHDPTLLFTNAGMNQFKSIFLGTVEPDSPLASLRRAVNSQKCIRAGGKHNDLDDVGKDTYHHTFFEMLGTWSFGDYFKQEAIASAFDILTTVYAISPERLYVTYFGGDTAMNLPADTEARDFWLQYLPKERVLPFDRKANFWEMGDTGPCGPCSEIHYDRIGHRDASALVNMDDPDVIEIWNLVFMQYSREVSGALISLPKAHIDTGMGLERLTSILQGKCSNYDTDGFQRIMVEIQKEIGCSPYAGLVGAADVQYHDTAYRILADHLRTLSFAIADGAYPSNEGRGYVIRRILRRAVRYGLQTLQGKPGFLHRLMPVVGSIYGNAYPELLDKQAEIVEIVKEEEEAFAHLLMKGVKYLNDILPSSSTSAHRLGGAEAFHLYDSLGFPLDLTVLMAKERGVEVDTEGFQAAMAEQQARGRKATVSKRLAGRSEVVLDGEDVSVLQAKGILATVDRSKDEDNRLAFLTPLLSASVSPNCSAFTTSVVALCDSSGLLDKISLAPNVTVGVVLHTTPFYAESGGQVADQGQLVVECNGKLINLQVLDVQSYAGYILHTCTAPSAVELSVNGVLRAEINTTARALTAAHHTVTHLLHHALRKVCADKVEQRGSLVSAEKLRLDFTCKAPTEEELVKVEDMVNSMIRQALPVSNAIVPLYRARTISGLRKVFGEVYPNKVRVLSVGADIAEMMVNPQEERWEEYSVEFCAGTHLTNTKQAEGFVILEESAISKGIRRIVAVAGPAAQAAHERSAAVTVAVHELEQAVGNTPIVVLEERMQAIRQCLVDDDISHVVRVKLRRQLDTLHKLLYQMRAKELTASLNTVIEGIVQEATAAQAAGKKRAVFKVSVDGKALKMIVDEVRTAAPELSFMLVGEDADKLALLAFATDAAQKAGLHAANWLNATLSAHGGKGGGRAGLAQGNIPLTDKDLMTKVVAAADAFV